MHPWSRVHHWAAYVGEARVIHFRVGGINKGTEHLNVLLITYLFTELSLSFLLNSTVAQRRQQDPEGLL